MSLEKTVSAGSDPIIYLRITSTDNVNYKYLIAYDVKNAFNTEAQSQLHIYLNGKCILDSNLFWVYNKGARRVASREGTFQCSGKVDVYGTVTSNVSSNKERWNLKTPSIIHNDHITPSKPQTTITYNSTNLTSNGITKGYVIRIPLLSSDNKFNSISIKRTASNASKINTAIYRNGSKLADKTADFSITFTEADRNSIYEFLSSSVSSTNDTANAEKIIMFVDVNGNLYDTSNTGYKLFQLYKMIKG